MTLGSLLRAYRTADADAARVIAAARSVFDVRKVRVNQPFRLYQAIDGTIRRFEYEIDGDRVLQIGRRASDVELTAEVLPIRKTSRPTVLRGTITRDASSLFAAMGNAGGNVDLSISLASVFAGEVDFNTDLQPGDTFELLVDQQFRESRAFAGYGPILAAELDNAGRRLRAIRFAPAGSAPAYFDEHGASMHRFMLHSPLKFEPTVSSGFSFHRLHPILNDVRAHLGVDYRAPAGAPVVAVADGLVVEAGARGGAGRMVHLRHANGFESEYLHLSSIAVQPRAHVHQGDVIGRVGATGLATGPHLDYRVKKNGVFVNPLTASRGMPPADPVPASDLAAFSALRDRTLGALRTPAASRSSAEELLP
jgi:murein DD-endopeptidase MepM/ murein hydrolase activator NlpD